MLIGPQCPVMQLGQSCPDLPYQTTLTITKLNGGRVAQVQSDADGYFKLPLAAGEYILHPESADGISHASEQNFVVEEGAFTWLAISYDSGIR